MSHVRNLFHNGVSDVRPAPSIPVPVVPASEFGDGIRIAAKDQATAFNRPAGIPLIRPEFAVEQANIRPEHRLVYYTDPHSPAADRFRYLRMRLREPWSAGKLKKLLITSPLPKDGKSTIILNLATALSERGQRSVLLIEADLHKSCLSERLGLKIGVGLSECLHDGLDPLSAIRRVDPFGWHVLAAGEPPTNPTELLQTPAAATVFARVSSYFDWVLVDSPPAIALTDAISLQQHVDASLLVVRAGSTPREAIDEARGLLGATHIIGVVLNGVDPRKHLYSRYGSYEPT